MKKNIKLIIVIIGIFMVGVGIFIGISALDLGPQQTNDSRVTYKEKVLTIILKENPTTPYAWTFTIEGESLKALDDKYISDPRGQMKSGVGGTHIFHFEGVSEGTAIIHMVHEEQFGDPEERYPIEIIIIETHVESDGVINYVKVVN